MRAVLLLSVLLTTTIAVGQPSDSLCVYQCGPDTMVTSLAFDVPRPMFINPSTDQLYLTTGGPWPSYTSVLDCATDSVVGDLRFGFDAPFVFDSTNNKIFGSDGDYDYSLIVCDIEADTSRRILFRASPSAMCWSPRSGKLYVPCAQFRNVLVYDCATEALVNELAINAYEKVAINPVQDKFYAVLLDTVYVFDVATDTLLAKLYGHGQGPPMWNPYDSMVYLFSSEVIWKVDGQADSVVDSIVGDFSARRRLCHDVRDNVLYVLVDYWDIKAIDLNSGAVRPEVPGFVGTRAVYDSIDHRVYGVREDRRGRWISVYDCATNRILRTIETPNANTWGLVWHPTRNKLYSGGDPLMAVGEEPEGGGMKPDPLHPTILHAADLARTDCRVLDITGRDVTERKARLTPGIYFLRRDPDVSAVTKVVVQR